MTINKETPYGGINISMQAIGNVAGNAAAECYGVIGLSNKSVTIFESVLTKKEYYKGVVPKKIKDDYAVDLYVVLAYGLKITEVVAEIQKKVKYVLEKTFDLKFKAINVYVTALQNL